MRDLKTLTMQHLYAMFVNLSDLRVLVVGAGAVAARKVRGLIDGGACHVTVIAPAISAELPESVETIRREFLDSDLEGVDLCFAATDDRQVNSHIVELCRRRRILVNRADRDEEHPGSFTVPAVHRSGAVTIAVSAAGSPKLAACVRDEIASELDESWGRMGEAIVCLRDRIVAMTALPQARRAEMIRALTSRQALEMFDEGGLARVEAWLGEQFADLRKGE